MIAQLEGYAGRLEADRRRERTVRKRELPTPAGAFWDAYFVLVFFAFLLAAGSARAERIKDLASIQGVRSNQLIGYGLVVGLDGSGDQTVQTPFTIQTLNNMLNQMG